MRALQGHEHAVECLAFGPAGKLLASAETHSIRLWDLATGSVTWTLSPEDEVQGVYFEDDGALLVAAGNSVPGADGQPSFWMARWSTTTGELVSRLSVPGAHDGISGLGVTLPEGVVKRGVARPGALDVEVGAGIHHGLASPRISLPSANDPRCADASDELPA